MQKLVKKNLEKKPNKIVAKETIKKSKYSFKKQFKSLKSTKSPKFSKSNKLKVKRLKLARAVANLVSGRPYRKYELKPNAKLLNLNVKVKPNNVFCILKDLKRNRVLSSVSAGSYKLNVSKKTVRHYSKQIIHSFLKTLREKNIQFNRPLVAKITAPTNLRKAVLDSLKTPIFKKLTINEKLFIDVPSLKVFNGCRPCKQIRKKRKGLSLFK